MITRSNNFYISRCNSFNYDTLYSENNIFKNLNKKVFKKIKHLNIGRNYLHPDSAKALAETKTLINIETLLMIENYLGDEGVKMIMESKSFTKLKNFRVL